MDGDPAVEHQLDSFSLTFPLPYRVAFIVILGAYSSATQLTEGSLTPCSRLGMGL
jgi:hypothetical protein